jgi:hypothetical protein
MFGVAPPMASDYLHSTNNNMLTPLITADGENDNFSPKPDGNNLYYHL